ncbi:transmembrane protein 244-like [Anneissia japonica]|uniref:transmembrane protein 244-like n=1 Tax=Anneissia japonica TaxID=1529436 RepID=UPI001425ABAF|nr:transmembrane protein 244-like [Anneissia japonica]
MQKTIRKMLQTKEIVINLVFCLLLFYSVFYMIASLMHGIFVLDDFDGKIPFNVDSFESMFSNATLTWNDKIFLADFLSLECTCLIVPLTFVVLLHERLWDFAATTVLIHVIIVCIVNLALPVWEWWVCIIIGTIFMIILAESLNACFRRSSSKETIDKNKEK